MEKIKDNVNNKNVSKKKKLKISYLQIVRHIIQLSMLLLGSGIFATALNGIKSFIFKVADGSYNGLTSGMLTGLILLLCTFIFGRFFCGWLCLFGAYSDLIYGIFGRFTKKLQSKLKSVGRYLKYLKYISLAFIIVLCATENQSFMSGKDIWESFGMLSTLSVNHLDSVMLSLIALIVVTILSAFWERFYCRFLCPLGALFSLVDRLKLFTIFKPNDKCGKCRICTNNCPMDIELYKTSEVCSGECIKCMKCVESCPRKNTSLSVIYKKIPKWVSSVGIAVIIFIAYKISSSINL